MPEWDGRQKHLSDRANDRLQCRTCRWLGVRADLQRVFQNKIVEQWACPDCHGEHTLKKLQEGEEPMPQLPMREDTKALLKLMSFTDCGTEKGKRVFSQRDTRPMVTLRLKGNEEIWQVVQAIERFGEDYQADRTRERWQEVFASFRRGLALPGAREMGEAIVPAAAAESAGDEDWEFLRQQDGE